MGYTQNKLIIYLGVILFSTNIQLLMLSKNENIL